MPLWCDGSVKRVTTTEDKPRIAMKMPVISCDYGFIQIAEMRTKDNLLKQMQ